MLNERLAAIVPLSSALMDDDVQAITPRITNGEFQNLPIWNFIHTNDSGAPSRALFNELSNQGYDVIIAELFDAEEYNLTEEQVDTKINEGARYLYTQFFQIKSAIC